MVAAGARDPVSTAPAWERIQWPELERQARFALVLAFVTFLVVKVAQLCATGADR